MEHPDAWTWLGFVTDPIVPKSLWGSRVTQVPAHVWQHRPVGPAMASMASIALCAGTYADVATSPDLLAAMVLNGAKWLPPGRTAKAWFAYPVERWARVAYAGVPDTFIRGVVSDVQTRLDSDGTEYAKSPAAAAKVDAALASLNRLLLWSAQVGAAAADLFLTGTLMSLLRPFASPVCFHVMVTLVALRPPAALSYAVSRAGGLTTLPCFFWGGASNAGQERTEGAVAVLVAVLRHGSLAGLPSNKAAVVAWLVDNGVYRELCACAVLSVEAKVEVLEVAWPHAADQQYAAALVDQGGDEVLYNSLGQPWQPASPATYFACSSHLQHCLWLLRTAVETDPVKAPAAQAVLDRLAPPAPCSAVADVDTLVLAGVQRGDLAALHAALDKFELPNPPTVGKHASARVWEALVGACLHPPEWWGDQIASSLLKAGFHLFLGTCSEPVATLRSLVMTGGRGRLSPPTTTPDMTALFHPAFGGQAIHAFSALLNSCTLSLSAAGKVFQLLCFAGALWPSWWPELVVTCLGPSMLRKEPACYRAALSQAMFVSPGAFEAGGRLGLLHALLQWPLTWQEDDHNPADWPGREEDEDTQEQDAAVTYEVWAVLRAWSAVVKAPVAASKACVGLDADLFCNAVMHVQAVTAAGPADHLARALYAQLRIEVATSDRVEQDEGQFRETAFVVLETATE